MALRRGLNAGIAAASSPVVELLNDDAEVTEGWTDSALAWFADERIAAVAPLVLQNDPARRARGLPPLIDTAGDEYDPGGFAREMPRAWPRHLGEERSEEAAVLPSPHRSPEYVFGASACAAFYRRETLLAAGGVFRSTSARILKMLTCRSDCDGSVSRSSTSQGRSCGTVSPAATGAPRRGGRWSGSRATRSGCSGGIPAGGGW